MKMEFEVIPEVRRRQFHSEEIEVSDTETIGQAISREHPNLVSMKPDAEKKFIITVVITGREVDA